MDRRTAVTSDPRALAGSGGSRSPRIGGARSMPDRDRGWAKSAVDMHQGRNAPRFSRCRGRVEAQLAMRGEANTDPGTGDSSKEAPRIRTMFQHTLEHEVPAGTILFAQGEVPTFQIVVLSGSVQLFGRSRDGREVLIEVVRAPDLLIPAAVVTASPYLMQGRAPEPTRFLLIPADAFRDAVERNPHLAKAVLETLAEQFRRMVRQTKNLKLRSAAERVGCHILVLSERQGTPDRAILPYEKHMIASELGMTRESFSRALKALTKIGIGVAGQEIVIRDRARLTAVAKPDPMIDLPAFDDTGRRTLALIERLKG
ncbi:cyclic nucleotide-binding domain-containing protein [Methylobacterium sp. 092160098-2]|uniref:cyclic nucleotide-binding domain-containing protein n=1 Tax=Methylobacterium sp. 092160098-2 TaxID=3025129 RepID=UPI0023819817|nr:cyclic nucleotide-binding domain-containing protein [Methylobacterium sp. 092160098-2]MDE4910321.1 cyclic nucleotide-binding domain-containing protein [Methylobacterium sp. 092160098-2]